MINTCVLRLLLVGTEPGSGGSDPQTPRRWGECPPPRTPPQSIGCLRRWGGLTADLLVCGMKRSSP